LTVTLLISLCGPPADLQNPASLSLVLPFTGSPDSSYNDASELGDGIRDGRLFF
jgi:hypothetical protein